MRKAIVFLMALIAIGMTFYACRKTDTITTTYKYSHLPAAVAEAARWYDKQMNMGGVTRVISFVTSLVSCKVPGGVRINKTYYQCRFHNL